MKFHRQRLGSVCKVVAGAVALDLVLAENAHAYLDPGTVSFVFQTILATVLGSLFVLKRYWRQITDGVKKRFSTKKQDDETES